MAGSIIVSSITLDSDNNFSIKSNTGATLFFANTTGIDIANSIGATAITNDKILSVANTKITGNIISSQITSVANTQISGNIASSQITSNPTLYGNVSVTGVIGVGGATPSTSGSGISFPATQSASSDANTLDDYEEGTWTPAFGYSGGNGTMSISYANQFGYYTKVGNLVFIRGDMRITSFTKGTASGAPWIVGLPFTPQNNAGYGGSITNINPYQWPITSTPFGAMRADGTPAMQLQRLVSNSVNANLDDPDGDAMLFFSGVYQV